MKSTFLAFSRVNGFKTCLLASESFIRGSLWERWTSWKCFTPGWRNNGFGGMGQKSRRYIIGSWSCSRLTPSTTPFLRQSSFLMDARFSLQRENSRRGFSLYVSFIFLHVIICSNNLLVSTSHQKVALEIDFSGALWVRVPMTVFFVQAY